MSALNEEIGRATLSGDAPAVMRLYLRRVRLARAAGLRRPHAAFLTGRAAIIDQLWLAAASRARDKEARRRLAKALYL